MANKLYKVRFVNENQIYEIYAHHVYQGQMYGFIIIEDIVFEDESQIVVDPSQERLKEEFANVRQTLVPMHAVLRIDQVEKQGSARIDDVDDNKIARFPSPVYTPRRPDGE